MNWLPERGLSIVYLLVFRADLIVSAECRAQEKWRRKQIIYLRPIRLGFATHHPLDGKRLVYERQLMGVILGKAPKIGEETSPFGRQVIWQRSGNRRGFLHLYSLVRSGEKAIHPGIRIHGSLRVPIPQNEN